MRFIFIFSRYVLFSRKIVSYGLADINALEIGVGSMMLGGGRETMNDVIDMSVGVILNKKIDDYVNAGDVLAYVHTNGKNTEKVVEKVLNAFKFGDTKVGKQLILKVIR